MILSDRGGRRRRKGGILSMDSIEITSFLCIQNLLLSPFLIDSEASTPAHRVIQPVGCVCPPLLACLPIVGRISLIRWKPADTARSTGRHFITRKKKEGVLRSNATLLPPFSINWKASMLRLKFTKRVRWLRQIGTCWSSRAWNPTGYETQQEREDFFFSFQKLPVFFFSVRR